MPGNPFRVSQQQNPSSAAPPPPISFHDAESRGPEISELGIDTDHASLPANTKNVRIGTPTFSPPHPVSNAEDSDLSQNVLQARHTRSPAPYFPSTQSYHSEDEVTADPFAKNAEDEDSSSGEEEPINITGEIVNTTESSQRTVTGGAPYNPFAKTPSTTGLSPKSVSEPREYTSSRPTAETKRTGNARASLDVEGFKRLLLTGSAHPSHSGSHSAPPPGPNPNSLPTLESSSTDTSSVSRQSIFEPIQESHTESPRTSYEMPVSEDEDRVHLVSEPKKPKQKPPPPKHRHGKLVTARTPQTVSFSEFSPSFSTKPASSPLSRERANSDLNKPLPPTPQVSSPPAHIASQDTSLEESGIRRAASNPLPGHHDPPITQKKAPPPVPLARRQSQLRSSNVGNRSRSNSSLTISSQISTELLLASPASTQEPTSHPHSLKSAPPPPPARRHGHAASTISTPDSSTTELPSTATSRRLPGVSATPPPSRHSTFISPPISRGSSGLSRTKSMNASLNPRSVSDPSTTHTMAPPPPPPRRRQSGRSSLDKERPSRSSLDKERPTHVSVPPADESGRSSSEMKRTSFDGQRRTSMASESSLRYEYAPALQNDSAILSPTENIKEEPPSLEDSSLAKTNTSDILDDMERFQREIDELRGKFSQTHNND